jgi:hypothetical protein
MVRPAGRMRHSSITRARAATRIVRDERSATAPRCHCRDCRSPRPGTGNGSASDASISTGFLTFRSRCNRSRHDRDARPRHRSDASVARGPRRAIWHTGRAGGLREALLARLRREFPGADITEVDWDPDFDYNPPNPLGTEGRGIENSISFSPSRVNVIVVRAMGMAKS